MIDKLSAKETKMPDSTLGHDSNPIPSPTHKPTLSLPADQPSYIVGKDNYTFVVTGADTNGRFAFFDGMIPPGGGPPPHCHGYEEMLFVVEGELTVFYEQSRTLLTKNTVLHIPGWAPHMLKNFSSAPVRIFCTTSPPGLEDQFAEIGTRVPHRNSPPPVLSPADQDRIAKLMPGSSERHNARLLPPNMFDHLLEQPKP